ncbi:MAG TPA: MarR family transcriptional regulator [Candidatus Limnocylindria bacterium]
MTQTISQPSEPSAAASTADQLLDELGELVVSERTAYMTHAHQRSLSLAHMFLMAKIHAHGPMTMSKVAELIGSGLPTATGLINRMEERGLVRREHDTRDRRVVLVSLTRHGAADIAALNAARRRRLSGAINQLSARDQASLLSGIRALRAAFQHANEGVDTQ